MFVKCIYLLSIFSAHGTYNEMEEVKEERDDSSFWDIIKLFRVPRVINTRRCSVISCCDTLILIFIGNESDFIHFIRKEFIVCLVPYYALNTTVPTTLHPQKQQVSPKPYDIYLSDSVTAKRLNFTNKYFNAMFLFTFSLDVRELYTYIVELSLFIVMLKIGRFVVVSDRSIQIYVLQIF